jgi:hypothetical protein
MSRREAALLEASLQTAAYVCKLLAAVEAAQLSHSHDGRGGGSVAIARQLSAPSFELTAALVGNLRIDLELVLFTGSIYRLRVAASDLNTPLSLLALLYSKMLGAGDGSSNSNGSDKSRKSRITSAANASSSQLKHSRRFLDPAWSGPELGGVAAAAASAGGRMHKRRHPQPAGGIDSVRR